MSETPATLKDKGTAAFRAGQYAVAARAYSDALLLDPRSVVLLNNRSAAHHKLGKFDEALSDAMRSTAIDPSAENAKGFARLGAAYWSLGSLELAASAYETCVSLGGGSDAAQNLSGVRAALAAQGSGNANAHAAIGGQHDGAMVLAGVAVIVLSIVHFVSSLLAPGPVAFMAWQGALLAFLIRQGLTLAATQSAWRPGGGGLGATFTALRGMFAGSFALHYGVVCAVLLVLRATPQLLLLAAMAQYVIVDVASGSRRAVLDARIAAAGGAVSGLFQRSLAPRLANIASNAGHARDQMLSNAALCEVMTAALGFLSGASFAATILLWQFVKLRFRSGDRYPVMAFQALDQLLGKAFYHPRCPPAIGGLYNKFKTLFAKLGQ